MIYHEYPVKDVFPHKLDGFPCECIPEFTQDDNGNIVIIHNAYDGRDIISEVENEC